jgi:hypothetical protein
MAAGRIATEAAGRIATEAASRVATGVPEDEMVRQAEAGASAQAGRK